jgi:hypothetical protein
MEERFVTEGATTHQPVTASDQGYGSTNTRPSWVNELPDPDSEAVRFTGSAWFHTTAHKD